jgi:hypothetical protein
MGRKNYDDEKKRLAIVKNERKTNIKDDRDDTI